MSLNKINKNNKPYAQSFIIIIKFLLFMFYFIYLFLVVVLEFNYFLRE